MAPAIRFEIGGPIITLPPDEVQWLRDELMKGGSDSPRRAAYFAIDDELEDPKGKPITPSGPELSVIRTVITHALSEDSDAVGAGLNEVRRVIDRYLAGGPFSSGEARGRGSERLGVGRFGSHVPV
jgi:hypothetical protein